jgi:hypothetical protein
MNRFLDVLTTNAFFLDLTDEYFEGKATIVYYGCYDGPGDDAATIDCNFSYRIFY